MVLNIDKEKPMDETRSHILLVEDNPTDAMLVQMHIEKLNNFKIKAVEQLSEAISCLEKKDFQMVLLDLCLPDAVGLEGLIKIRRMAPRIPIVVFTGLNDEELGIMALQRGAQDYLVKGKENNRLIQAMLYAIERIRISNQDSLPTDTSPLERKQSVRSTISRDAIDIAEENKKRRKHEILTERELQVLKLLGKGYGNQEMAELLGVSITTVKTHISSILQKLDVGDRTKAVVAALRCGLI